VNIPDHCASRTTGLQSARFVCWTGTPILSRDMTIRFIARAVGVEDGADGCLSAGIAETEDGDGLMFDFQCSMYEPDEQDIALGWDTHCVVTANQGTAYGAVNELILHGNVLHIILDPDDLEALGLPDPEIEATIEADAEAIEEFRKMLRRILAYGREEARPSVVHL
jgi:hypothetical protein